MGARRRTRVVLGAAIVVGFVAGLVAFAPVSGSAGPDADGAAERAAREITVARERANAIADELWSTQSAYDLLVEEEVRLAGQLERLQLEVDALRENVESIAVTRFVASGSEGIPLLTDVRAPNERVRADVLVGVVADVGATALDDFDAARVELAATAFELERTKQTSTRQQERLERLRADAETEVQRLREVEQQRLQDDAVRRALDARLREEQREREESERRAAESALRAESDAAAELAAAVPEPARRVEPTGGSDGGRTGASGGGSSPGSAFVDVIACPVIGGSAWGDTWGAPRSGGRRHQGVDMLAPIGTPLVAVVSGLTEHRTNRLGGITITLLGDNGNRYYYAHLDAYEGAEGRVGQGQVIGYLGDTGNATGVPHLHFEVRPNGGVPVNPTPSVRAAGC
jgi:peptidoglycan LD-endopeptidase LytH